MTKFGARYIDIWITLPSKVAEDYYKTNNNNLGNN